MCNEITKIYIILTHTDTNYYNIIVFFISYYGCNYYDDNYFSENKFYYQKIIIKNS